MSLRPAALLLILPVLACRPETPQPRTEPTAEPAPVPVDAPAPDSAPAPPPTSESTPAPPATEIGESDATGVRAEIEPPVAIESPSPDWGGMPGGKAPGPGGTYELRIDETGAVTDVRVLRAGHPGTDMVMLKAIRRWRFEPAKRDGTPIPVRWQVSAKLDAPAPR